MAQRDHQLGWQGHFNIMAADAPTKVAAPAAVQAEQPVPVATPVHIIPLIGEMWPEHGGIYAGMVRAEGDMPQHHVILLTAEPSKRMTWQEAMDWAASIGGELPTRSEGALLYANARELFEQSAWYWLAPQHGGSCAWYQNFYGGNQNSSNRNGKGCARAVRRLVL